MIHSLLPGTCLFYCSRRTSCQSSGNSWKMFAVTRISSSDDQYIGNLIRLSIPSIWSNGRYIGNLVGWSILLQFDLMINTMEILSNDRFHQVDMIQIILWFALGRDLLICDLNVFVVEKLLLIMMCDTSQCGWYIKIESICDNQRAKFYPLEASATHDKVARSFSSLVIFQYFLPLPHRC